MTVMHHSLPSPEYTGDSDSDSDIILELEQKRRQLDEEVARFGAQKDKEFRDFEAELKARKRQKRAQQQPQKDNASNYYEFTKNSPSTTPPSVSLLGGCERKVRSPNSIRAYKQSEPIKLMKSNVGSKVTTPPTIRLDRTNIKGENIPQSHANALQTPPTPHDFSLPSSSQAHASSDSASIQSEPPRDKPPLSPAKKNHEQAFARLFISACLPHHDKGNGQDQIDRPTEGTQTEPASPTDPTMVVDAMPPQSSSLPTQSSLTDSLQMPSTRRAYTSPSTVTRRTLAPIIRNVNGRKRSTGKRKHVTFQLADRAIVEPSSSYEEGLSPDAENESSDRRTSDDSTDSASSQEPSEPPQRPVVQRRNTPGDPLGRRIREITPVSTPDAEIGMSMGDLLLAGGDEGGAPGSGVHQKPVPEEEGYFSPRHTRHLPTSSSPEKSTSFNTINEDVSTSKRKHVLTNKRAERRNSKSPNTSPTPSRKNSLPHTGSAVHHSISTPRSPRFTPHTSPTKLPPQSQQFYPGTLEDDILSNNNNIGFFELDEELRSPIAGLPRPELPDHKDDDLESKNGKKTPESRRDPPSDLQMGTSVPINIVRTGSLSGSWVGTFGH